MPQKSLSEDYALQRQDSNRLDMVDCSMPVIRVVDEI